MNNTMNPRLNLPALPQLKQQAARLRAEIERDGLTIGHSRSLEMLAHQYGYKDWNTLHAAAGNGAPLTALAPGSRVSGRYLGHRFEATVKAVNRLAHSQRLRITLDFDEAIDVVRFEGMSNLRRRVSADITPEGRSVEKISDGTPVMALDL